MLAVLPRGEAIRNFVYAPTMEVLRKQCEVDLLSVVPGEESWKGLKECSPETQELVARDEAYPVRLLREILDVAHGRYLWSQAAQLRWEIRDHEADNFVAALKRSTKKIAAWTLGRPGSIDRLASIERQASRWFNRDNYYADYLQRRRPDLVFNASHVHSRIAVPVVQAAQWLGIPTATFLFSWDNLTSQGRILPAYDHYLVWNEDIRRQLLDIYPRVQASQITVTGTPQFDFHFQTEHFWTREEYCRRLGLSPRKPIVLYTTGMPNHFPGEERIVEGIGDALAAMTDLGPPQLVVRVYPKDRTSRFESLKQRRPDIHFPEIPWEPAWLTPKREDLPLWTNMLRHCEAGINICSTVTLELCMLDKPAINLAYDPPGMDIRPLSFARYYQFDHYRPIVASGALEYVASEDLLPQALDRALRAPGTRQNQRRELIRSFFGETLDGKSSHRVAAALAAFARQNL
ncbi:MAG: hypothetical protein K2X35_13660 [Bryobacteraceae bacterium]|nr:hypothetical protein [Bryobacteraceae bacterium]